MSMTARLVMVLAAVLALLAGGWKAYSMGRADGRALEREAMAQKVIEATNAARTEEQQRAAQAQKVANETHQALARARADADAAADAGHRLRQQIAILTASCRAGPGDSATAAPGAPAESTADLLANVQRRLDEAQERIARFADEAHASGLACQRIHEGLN